ncbi:MAG: ubiquinol-cytochrome C chaperone family protein [Hyphomicrobium aestuarii]|nr:ubiquinol-cytochrome C chaperone family protein [Hyphomicrobium aestuarii]
MFDWIYGRRDDRQKASEIYGAVVAQARNPEFYTSYAVPDSIEGRYEMIALHLAIVLERLGAADVADEELRRSLVETFVTAMDDAMRELGVGDTSVVRNVKKAAGGLYERGLDYRAALANTEDPSALASVVARHVYASDGAALAVATAAVAAELATYTRRMADHLAGLSADRLRLGDLSFPDARNDGRGT